MEIGLYIWNLKSKIYIFSLIILIVSCDKEINESTAEIDFKKIENGFLVCRLGNGYFSNYFKKYASKEQKYSHIGITSIENDIIYVYHSEASEFTGVGYVKKEKLNFFLKDIEVYDFFEFCYPDSIKTKILNSVKSYYNNKTPFDLDFNSFKDDKLYCTELIATSINKSFDSIEINPSLMLNNKKLYALDDIYLNKNVKKITFANNSYK